MALKFCTSICADSTNPTTISKLQLADVEAKTTETAIAYIKADGCIVSGTSSGGGSLNMSGSTVNGLTTYVNSTTICAEPNITFDGSVLGVTGNVAFNNSAARAVCMSPTTTAVANSITIKGTDLSYYCDDTTPMTGGGINIIGGIGYNEDDSLIGCGFGGNVVICAGMGCICYGAISCGGDVILCGGCGTYDVGYSDEMCGGSVKLYGGTAEDTLGNVQLHYGTSLKFYTASYGTFTVGTAISSIACATTCVKTAVLQATTGAAAGRILTSDAAGAGTWCDTVDISANLGTGDLLYYDGATISGSTFTQNSATVTTFRGDCLMICSDAASKIIKMCDNTTVAGSRNLYLCSAYGCCGYGGSVYMYAGYGDRPSGGVSSTYTCGGNIYMCGGNGCNCITTAGTVSCGGNVCIYGGWACNCYSAGAARGGDIILCGGYAYGTTSANCGGNITISTGYGGTCYGALYMTAGSVAMCLSAALNCVYISRRVDVYGCSSNIGLRVCYGCGYALCWVGSSDCRLKKDIEPYTGALSTITQLQAVRYHDCDDIDCPKNQVGLIAQDVEPILPEIVSCIEVTEEEKEKYGICDIRYGLSYDKLTAVLVEAIKEQQIQINELKTEINILKGC